jgi:hypothetical protein
MRISLTVIFLFFNMYSKAQKSLLAEGKWLKVKIQKTGVYHINKSILEKYKINTGIYSPQKMQFFTGPKGQLAQENNKEVSSENLRELPIYIFDNNDKWDKQDYIAFFVEGYDYFEESEKVLHTYDAHHYVFIKLGAASTLKLEALSASSSTDKILNKALVYERQENEISNVLKSGRQWFGDFFYNNLKINYKASAPLSDINCQLNVMGIGRLNQRLDIVANKSPLLSYTLAKSDYNPTDTYDRYNRYANVSTINFDLKNSSEIELELKLATENSPNNGAYIDFISWKYTAKIQAIKNQTLAYIYPDTTSFNGQISLENATTKAQVWVPTEKETRLFTINEAGKSGSLQLKPGQAFYVHDLNFIQAPLEISTLENQDLNLSTVPALLIVYAPRFKTQAERLKKHKTDQGLKTELFSTQQIYQALSSGKVDPTAIRDYCRFLWEKDKNTFKYLLLLGDASYDYKNNQNLNFVKTEDMVPTYESRESLEPIYSYNSDDYFGFLEKHEGYWAEGRSENNIWYSNTENDHTLDISVGRIPAKTQTQAQWAIDKIIAHESQSKIDFRDQKLLMVADNRDYNLHTDNVENLSRLAKISYPGFETEKLYIDAFEINQAQEAPAASKALSDQVNTGVFLINYAGHGSETGWAQEKLLAYKDILSWKNSKYPIFFTATCQFGKFDNPSLESGAELALSGTSHGAVAFLTTTRPVYASTNEKINQAFFKYLNTEARLGDVFRLTKNQAIIGEINRNFSLLGDPSLKLIQNNNLISVQKINGQNPYQKPLNALENIKIEGLVSSENVKEVYYELLDKPEIKKTKGQFKDEESISYETQNRVLVAGKVVPNQRKFELNFSLPLDQIKAQGKGLLRFIGLDQSGRLIESGFYENLVLDAIPKNPIKTEKPKINLSFDEKNKILKMLISDDLGLFSGSSKNFMTIDDSIKTDLYLDFSKNTDPSKIEINKDLRFLSSGKHTVNISIFDIEDNNSSSKIDIVMDKEAFQIQNLLIYPNPIVSEATLNLQHNAPGENLEATLSISDRNGRNLGKYSSSCTFCEKNWIFGLNFENLYSDNNILIYTLEISSQAGKNKDTSSGRLIFLK